MERIIDVIFSNPLFIFILIGALASVFRGSAKKNPNQSSNKKTQNGQPIDWKTIFFPEMQSEQRQPPVIETDPQTGLPAGQQSQQSYGQNYDPYTGKPYVVQQSVDYMGAETRTEQKVMSEVFTAPTRSFSINQQKSDKNLFADEISDEHKINTDFGQEELVNGIVMAEILGLPRAKRKTIRQR